MKTLLDDLAMFVVLLCVGALFVGSFIGLIILATLCPPIVLIGGGLALIVWSVGRVMKRLEVEQ